MPLTPVERKRITDLMQPLAPYTPPSLVEDEEAWFVYGHKDNSPTQQVWCHYDRKEGTYVTFIRAVAGGKVYDFPREWSNPDAEYVKCLSEQYLDRANDEYLPDLDNSTDYAGNVNEVDRPVWVDPAERKFSDLVGYTLVPAAGKIVRCWYCDEEFSYREFSHADGHTTAGYKAFVLAMLVHYSEHKAADDKPMVTTYFPGKRIVRPDGSVAAEKPGVVRTWRINGGLLGAYEKPVLSYEQQVEALLARVCKSIADRALDEMLANV